MKPNRDLNDPLARGGPAEPSLFAPQPPLAPPAPTPPAIPLPAYHRNARPTERAAAARVASVAGTVRSQVLAWVVAAGDRGLSAAEGGAMLARERGLHPSDSSCRYTVAPRLTELSKAGLVRDSGQRRDGSIAWVATAAAAGQKGAA